MAVRDVLMRQIRFVEAAIIVGATAGLAMTGISVSVAFGLTGSVTCTAIMYIFPGIFHYIAAKQRRRGCCAKSLGFIAMGIGFAVMIASTIAIIMQAVSGG